MGTDLGLGPQSIPFYVKGPRGKPADGISLRFVRKVNLNSSFANANFPSDIPCRTRMPEFLRWLMTLSIKELKDRRLLYSGSRVEGAEAGTLQKRRHQPTT
ncbi:unnamed protein product [Fraxinus pennsylvanica]|uniref:Uncharacterized protein n=1 Tax=Fraxinus pennsylvanica TaxID=56036 RepID=A0AAD2A6W9_9LAMI|nr:unnamed protein product [Fraxinus pennsylvanica]